MVFMIYQKGVFKEILLPNIDNTDYQILIEKSRFNVKKSFSIVLEVINRQWYITDSKTYQLLYDKAYVDRLNINGGEIITVKSYMGDVLTAIVVDADVSLMSFEKYSLFHNEVITIGNDKENTIQYQFINLISKKHCVIFRSNYEYYVEDYSVNGIFVNGKRVNKNYKLVFGDIIELFGLKIVFFDDILALASRVGRYNVSKNLPKYTLSKSDVLGSISESNHSISYFNRAPRIFPVICTDKLVIEAPSTPQFSKKRSMLSVIGPSFTMAIPMLLGTGLAIFGSVKSGNGSSSFMYTGIITALGSALIGSLWAFFNVKETKRREVEEEAQRFNVYGNYLLEIAEYIKEKYKQNYEALYSMYPSAEECCDYDEHSSALWNRNYTHTDFLYSRLGVGDIDFQMDIQIPTERFSVTFDSLKDKPLMLYENFKILKNVPVGINLNESKLYGIAGGKNKAGTYIVVNNIIAQITTAVSYTDVKIAFCYNEKELSDKKQWEYIKWLPHIWSENKSIRYFATNLQETADVFFELSNIMRTRNEMLEQNNRDIKHKPHYLLFVSDASMLEGTIIGKYVFDNKNNYGLTTFILTDYYYNLPNACETIIQNDENFCGYYKVFNNSENACSLTFDKVAPANLMKLSKKLANITVHEVEDNTSIVSSLDFFEMYGIRTLKELNIDDRWRKNRTFNSMRALIGKKAGGAECYLDIHEKYHGPHGLVAGTTGSGKSELIQTFMLSLAINYSPNDIAFFVIDFKGGGMANLFSDLPHMAGQISNLSGNQIRRAMISIKSENLRRQKIFGEYGVNNINLYTRLYKSGEAAFPIPHLVIIIDEFAELKKEEPEFMRELISVAQVGRSLGVHLILATQKPNGTVDDNILSNAKFRLCLRVQDRQDSNDMLHKPDAAYITQAGRCYLQVGNDEIYELFQSGWSGAIYDDKNDGGKNDIVTMILPTGKTAIVGSHTKMKRKDYEKKCWYQFLLKQIKNICKIDDLQDCQKIIRNIEGNLARKVIEFASNAGYNIGFSNSEIRTVQNFINLVPSINMTDEDAVENIIAVASQRNIKLPEIKEKTQLEAIVEYIGKIATENGYNRKISLWMPLLETQIPLSQINGYNTWFAETGWQKYEKWSLNTIVGMYDDPQNQAQLPFIIDFAEGGHLAVCGSVVSGKSTFLQTLVFSLATKYSPTYVNFYIFDYSGGMLSSLEGLPHCGGVLKENDIDKTGKFFNMIQAIFEERKNLFNGGNYSQYVMVNGVTLPSIFIVIDNFASFKEKTENVYENMLLHLSREGVSYGIYLVISSAGFGMSEIQNRIGDNIRTVVSLEMSDKFKYMDVLRTTHMTILPESGIKGRGVASIEGNFLEFQTALAIMADDDYKRSQKIEEICKEMKNIWNGSLAKPIPFIPENPVFEEFKELDEFRKLIKVSSFLPFAYNIDDASIYYANLENIYCYSISGKRRTGKTNLLKLFMNIISTKNGRSVVIENNGSELRKLSLELEFEYFTTDLEIYNFFKEITPEFISRNKLKHQCLEEGKSDKEIFKILSEKKPIFIFVADITAFIERIYKPDETVGNMSGFFENIIEKGYLHNIYFFGCINTDDVATIAGYKGYQSFTGYKTGVHLGGNISYQRIYNFQNIHFSELSKATKKGIGLTPSQEDEAIAEKIVIPLVGGK